MILSLNGVPLGFSTTCKISDKASTNQRKTKEGDSGLFAEKYVTEVSETITTDCFEATDSRTDYNLLKSLLLTGTPVTLTYCYVNETKGFTGTFIITSLDQDSTAGDDVKFSLTFESSGAIQQATMTQSRTAAAVSASEAITPPKPSPGRGGKGSV